MAASPHELILTALRTRNETECSGRPLSPFVGRERELTMLQALLVHAEGGHGQVIGVSADSGLGKSHLLYEFRHSLCDDGWDISKGTACPTL